MKLVNYSVFFMLVLNFSGWVQAADLTVRIIGTPNKQGVVRVALYDDPKAFPEGKNRVSAQTLKADTGILIIYFKGLAAGKYALSAFHDENNNGILDRNFIGIPTEAYGFSNNPKTGIKPPTFEQAAINLETDNKTLTIELSH